MSGHSKWANIKHKKEKNDAVRGKVFTKIGREIAIAVKEGGPDPNTNSKLRDVVAKAKANNIPNDNIARSIKKAAGEMGSVNYEENTYEGYAAGGAAVIVECISDNKNRTVSDVRHAFDKCGGSMGATGCVAWMFEKKGIIVLDSEGLDEDEVTMDALEAGADDLRVQEGFFEIYISPEAYSDVYNTLSEKYNPVSAEISMIPQNTVALDAEAQEKMFKLLDMLDELDDVSEVYHNAELPEEEEED